MKANAEHPGVSVVDMGAGNTLKLSFRKIEADGKPKQYLRSADTTDYSVAADKAKKISNIIRNNLFDDPPEDTTDDIKTILGITTTRKERLELGVGETWATIGEAFAKSFDGKPPFELGGNLLEFSASLRRYVEMADGWKSRAEQAEQKAAELEALLKVADAKARGYEGLRIKEGLKVIKKFDKVTVKEAIANYLTADDGTEAGERVKGGYIKSVLNAFAAAKGIGEAAIIADIPPAAVVEYLKGAIGGGEMLRRRVIYIAALLRHATGGMYDVDAIRKNKWVRENAVREKKGDGDFYWPDRPTVNRMIAGMAAAANGRYWSDAATVCSWLALRPEEISLLQAENVIKENGVIVAVDVTPVVDADGNEIKELKTENSKARLPVNSDDAREALQRRLDAGGAFLFPRIASECGVRDESKHGKTRARDEARCKSDKAFAARLAFQRANHCWGLNEWARQFLKRVRAAGKPAGMKMAMLDGRTLRRARGKEIYDLTGDMEQVASMLRDDVETVRRHYAKPVAVDCKV